MTASILILGEYQPTYEPHAMTDAAIAHSAAAFQQPVTTHWVSTLDVDEALLRRHQGLWVAPGSPYKDMHRALQAIRFARENQIPCLGTCGGFQHMVLEYARNQLEIPQAQHAEYDPYATSLFVSRLACSLAGREMTLRFAPDSRVAQCYGATQATERYYCNFGVNPEHAQQLNSRDLRIVGSDAEGEARVIELAGHPFFIGTLYVPQSRSMAGAPHPLVTAFLSSAMRQGS